MDTGQGELHPGLSTATDTSFPLQAGPSLGLGRPDLSTVTTFQGPERTGPELGLRHSSSGQAQLCACTHASRREEETLREDRTEKTTKARLKLWPIEGSMAAARDVEPHAAPDTSGEQNRGTRTAPSLEHRGRRSFSPGVTYILPLRNISEIPRRLEDPYVQL